ncbi:MAG: methyltransferase domain-containing protein [bacterium]|nr:methyltransferase domain-containing protein [bacterium]
MAGQADPKEIAKQLRKPEGPAGIFMGSEMNTTNAFMTTTTFDMMNVEDNDHILEIGFGNGHFIGDLLNRAQGVKYDGLEISDVMMEEAGRKNREWIDRGVCKLTLGDVERMPYNDETFNKIVTINTSYFWEDPEEVVMHLYRVLKPGGSVCITSRPKEDMIKLEFARYGFIILFTEELEALLTDVGFKDFSCEVKTDPVIEIDGRPTSMRSQYVIARK